MNEKTISIVVPCYNEEGNVEAMCEALLALFDGELSDYGREILFVDNHSTDGTQEILQRLCGAHPGVRAIFNARNVGPHSSSVYGLLQASGDCAVLLACDFQEPVELIPEFVRRWEQGAQVVAGVRSATSQGGLVYSLRTFYYRMMRAGSDLEHIDHFTGYGLYDRSFLEIVREVNDPQPFLRGMVAEFGAPVECVEYKQPRRRAGKTHNGFFDLYDAAMLSFTSYTSMGLRMVTILGFIVSLVSLVIGVIYLVLKLMHWDTFNAGMAPVLIGLFFLGAVVLIAIGLIGEYLISINRRMMRRPLVVEARRIGFEEDPREKK